MSDDHKEPAVQEPAPHSASDVAAFNKHLKSYVLIGGIEFIFTILTVGISFFFENMGTKIAVTLLSATCQCHSGGGHPHALEG